MKDPRRLLDHFPYRLLCLNMDFDFVSIRISQFVNATDIRLPGEDLQNLIERSNSS